MSIPDFPGKYVAAIVTALKLGNHTNECHKERLEAVKALSDFKINSPLEICHGIKERLFDWPDLIFRSPKKRLTLILGETRNRSARGEHQQDEEFPMTPAATSDGVAACQVLYGALTSPASTQPVAIEATIDEWIRKGAPNLCESNLVIIGSGEVNLAALFLNGLVKDFYYGAKKDEPLLNSMGNTLYAGNDELQRHGALARHYGAVLLLKNPWNPEFRLLWISGLTGVATSAGSSLVQNSWKSLRPEESRQGKQAIGLVFEKTTSPGIVPSHWLVRGKRDEFNWVRAKDVPRETINTPVSTEIEFKYDAFISYRHEDRDREFARKLLKRLEAAGLKVAIDERDFDPSATFLEEMERCIKESRYTLSVASPRYFESGNCNEEAIICKTLDMADRRRRMIPLIIETVPMPTWLYHIVGIDFTDAKPLVDPHNKLIKRLKQ